MCVRRGASDESRFLVRLERGFWLGFVVFLAAAVLGQAALLHEHGRQRLSRVDRLEGTALGIVETLQ
ncbi:MAG TPA: hypothetical protein GX515_11425 [Firmicutes bacterium]|nr:hypothetical protein [Bacillota bacterium]